MYSQKRVCLCCIQVTDRKMDLWELTVVKKAMKDLLTFRDFWTVFKQAKRFFFRYSKDAASYHEDTCSTIFITALFAIVRNWKQPRCSPTKEQIFKNGVHLHNGGLLSCLKSNIMKFSGKQMELEKKNHPEQGHSDPRQTWYVLTRK